MKITVIRAFVSAFILILASSHFTAWADPGDGTSGANGGNTLSKTQPAKPSPTKIVKKDDGQPTEIREGKLRIKIGVYGDADYQLTGPSGSFPSNNSFSVGSAALFLTGRYGDHLAFVDENLVEFENDGPVLNVDRVLVGYTFSNELRISAGRDHTALGFWNRTFGYAAQLQTTIERPFFLSFEDDGGLIPVHVTGITADGILALGGPSLKYELNAGNGESIGLTGDGSGHVIGAELTDNTAGAGTNQKIFAGRLVFKPWANAGFSVGCSADWNRYDTIPETSDLLGSPLLFNGLNQVIVAGEIAYRDDDFEMFGEFFDFNDQIQGSSTLGTAGNRAFYAQLGWRVADDWKPYLRVENLYLDGMDPFFTAMLAQNQTEYLAGIRYEVVPTVSCLKLEGRLIQASSGNSAEVAAQWAFGF